MSSKHSRDSQIHLSSKIHQHDHGFKNNMWYINIAYQEYFLETISALFNLISVPLNIICLY